MLEIFETIFNKNSSNGDRKSKDRADRGSTMKLGTYQVVSSFLIIGIIIVTLFVLNEVGWINIQLFNYIGRLFK